MLRNFERLWGVALAAYDGEAGKVRDFFFEERNWAVRYLVVETGSWLAEREVLISPAVLGQLQERDNTIDVHLSKEQVRNSPPLETKKPLSRKYEELYHRHYGLSPYWTTVSATPGIWEESVEMPSAAHHERELREEASDLERRPYLLRACEVIGYTLHTHDAEIGRVDDFIIEDQDWRIRYVVVGTGRWFPGKRVLLDSEWIERISFDASEMVVNLSYASIKEAPEYDPNVPIGHELEQRLYEHYEHYGHRVH